ncbi:MAG: DUF433 domain-containing protein [Elusimicrobiota bacterium]|nr:DUF433 domain-containing protein [Elusimicrobiota bacterium]
MVKTKQENWSKRIHSDPKIMSGEPVIKGTRVTVSVIVGSIADGMTNKELLKAFPQIKEEDIRACLYYAAESAREDLTYELAL